jgi:epsilon-lactone hydrolase
VDNGKVLVYTHGGSYTRNSANSSVGSALLVANGTGLRVISVDYATAPFSKWNKTIDQVISVIQALVKADNKYPLTNILALPDLTLLVYWAYSNKLKPANV